MQRRMCVGTQRTISNYVCACACVCSCHCAEHVSGCAGVCVCVFFIMSSLSAHRRLSHRVSVGHMISTERTPYKCRPSYSAPWVRRPATSTLVAIHYTRTCAYVCAYGCVYVCLCVRACVLTHLFI